jgi:hypothetical protein
VVKADKWLQTGGECSGVASSVPRDQKKLEKCKISIFVYKLTQLRRIIIIAIIIIIIISELNYFC